MVRHVMAWYGMYVYYFLRYKSKVGFEQGLLASLVDGYPRTRVCIIIIIIYIIYIISAKSTSAENDEILTR